MSYEIIIGDSRDDAIRSKDFNMPNYPAGEPRGREEIGPFGTDLLDDPADPDTITDPKVGWEQGIGPSQSS